MSQRRGLWRRLGSAVIGLLLPNECRACGRAVYPFAAPSATPASDGRAFAGTGCSPAMNGIWCPACISAFRPIDSPLCSRCGMMFDSREGSDHLCGHCMTMPFFFTRARAVGVYDGPLMAIIHDLKYKGNTALARPLGSLLYSGFQRFWEAKSIDLVLPVPLHRKRMRKRGFNQAWLLIQHWPDWFEKTLGPAQGIQVSRNFLFRSRPTAPQTGMGKRNRRQNIKNAFTVTPLARIAEKRILLVDDVLTTGATADECARVLLAAGAQRVDVLTLARTM